MIRLLFTCSACQREGLDQPPESRCDCSIDGAHWIQSNLYTEDPDEFNSVADDLPAIGSSVLVYMDEPEMSFSNYAVTKFDKYGFGRSRVVFWRYLDENYRPEKRLHK